MMTTTEIGFNAGLVWNALNESATILTLKGLKKVTKLKEKELYAALGWLAREGKINLNDGAEDLEIVLIY